MAFLFALFGVVVGVAIIALLWPKEQPKPQKKSEESNWLPLLATLLWLDWTDHNDDHRPEG